MLTIERSLNIYAAGIPQIISLSQYDDDFQLVFTIYTSEGEFTIPSGTTAEVMGTKVDGNGYSANASISGSTVTVTGNKQMTACAGRNVYEIVLTKSGKRLATVNFILKVERAALDAETIQSESVLKELNAIIDSAETSTQAAAAAAASAEAAAESARTLTIDPTLTKSGQAADAKVVGDEINGLKEDLSEIEPGLSSEAKNALLDCFRNVAWIDDNGQYYFDKLYDTLYPEPEWGSDYTWLYKATDGVLLSERTDIVATTIGTGCVESLNDGILNLYVPENTNQIIRYNLNQSTNSNAKMTAKVRFKDVPIVTGAAGFRLQVSNGVSGTQIMEHRLRNQDPVFAYYESGNVMLLNDIVTFDEWHIISVELNNNKQIITVDGVKVMESSTLSTNYCTLNSIIAQNVVDASNEHELDVDVAWITYKNND